MPSRYSPRSRPPVTQPTVWEALSTGFDTHQELERKRRRERIEDEERARRRELEEIELARGGIRRGEAPTERAPDPLTGDIDLTAPGGVREPSGPSRTPARDATGTDIFGQLGEINRDRAKPKIRFLPGQFVPGQGFTTEAVFDEPEPGPRLGMAGGRRPGTYERTREGYEQLTEDRYLDVGATPAGRQREAAETERSRRTGALSALPHISREEAAALEAGAPAGIVFPPEAEPRTLRVGGRTFPDTPEGRAAAVEWERRISAAGRRPEENRPDEGRLTYQARLRDLQQNYGITGDRARAIASDPSAYRQIVLGEEGEEASGLDPRTRERREALIGELGEPVFPHTQIALDLYAQGRPVDSIIEEMRQNGAPPQHVKDVEDYLNEAKLGRF